MNHNIKIKKGLDIPLSGDAERIVVDMRSEERYAVKPPDVVGFTPRLLVAEGDEDQEEVEVVLAPNMHGHKNHGVVGSIRKV